MKYKISKTDTYETELINIISYLVTNFSSVVAKEYLNYLDDQIRNLETFPYIGKEILLIEGYQCRSLISKKNIVLYYVDEENKTVHLLYIVSANENYLNLLRP